MKRIYTERMHAYRLRLMLEKDDPCGKCPAARGFGSNLRPEEMWEPIPSPCGTCLKLLDLSPTRDCPCYELEEPVKASWLKLEEKGYI